MRWFTVVILMLVMGLPLDASLFRVHFWNLDMEEAALGGAVGSLLGFDFGPNLNPAALPVFQKPPARLARRLAFPNALRLAALLIYQGGALPVDAIGSDERWEETKHHSKWIAYSLLSLYRLHYFVKGGLTVSFMPLREVPAPDHLSLTSSSLALTLGIADLVQIGIEGVYYFMTEDNHAKPFSLSERGLTRYEGYGGSAGILLRLGRLNVGIDYRYCPPHIFDLLKGSPYPVRDGAFSLSTSFQITPEIKPSFDLVNWNNRSRSDFLSPRFGLQWRYFKHGLDKGKFYLGLFGDGERRPYASLGTALWGKLEGFGFKAGFTAIFDLRSGTRNALLLSFDFLS